MKENQNRAATGDPQMRIRPWFLLELAIIVAMIAWLASFLLPATGGPNSARRAMTRRDMTRIGAAISNQSIQVCMETWIHPNSSNRLSASFLNLTTNGLRVSGNGTNANGELLDFWRTPYLIEMTPQTNCLIRSAGKNGKLGDNDDLVFAISKQVFVKP